MDHAQAVILDLSSVQHGAVSTWQLRSHDLSYDEIDHLCDSGEWCRVTPLVLRRAGSARTRAQALMEAVLDAGRAAGLTHLVAAQQWGVNVRPGRVDVSRERATTTIPSRLASVHEPRSYPPHHRTVLDGIPISVPSRIPFEVAATTPSQAEKVLDRLWGRNLLGYRSINRMLDELAGRGRPGITLMRELLADRGPDYRPNDTNLEDRFQQLAREARIDDLERQRHLFGEEWLGRVDFLRRRRRVLFEVQSALYHDALIDQRSDSARRSAIEAAGYECHEFTDAEVWFDPKGTVARLRSIARGSSASR